MISPTFAHATIEHFSGYVRTFGAISSIEFWWEQYEITLYMNNDGNIVSVMDPKSVTHKL